MILLFITLLQVYPGNSKARPLLKPATVKVTGNCGTALVKQPVCLQLVSVPPERSLTRRGSHNEVTWCRTTLFLCHLSFPLLLPSRQSSLIFFHTLFPLSSLGRKLLFCFVCFYPPLCLSLCLYLSLSPLWRPYFSDFMSNSGSLPLLMFDSR